MKIQDLVRGNLLCECIYIYLYIYLNIYISIHIYRERYIHRYIYIYHKMRKSNLQVAVGGPSWSHLPSIQNPPPAPPDPAPTPQDAASVTTCDHGDGGGGGVCGVSPWRRALYRGPPGDGPGRRHHGNGSRDPLYPHSPLTPGRTPTFICVCVCDPHIPLMTPPPPPPSPLPPCPHPNT